MGRSKIFLYEWRRSGAAAAPAARTPAGYRKPVVIKISNNERLSAPRKAL
jgi:hypothetical protein